MSIFDKILDFARMEDEELEDEYYEELELEEEEGEEPEETEDLEDEEMDGLDEEFFRNRYQPKKKPEEWKRPKVNSYRNPNIKAYPNKKAYSGDVNVLDGHYVDDSGVIQPMIQGDSRLIQGGSTVIQGDSGSYYSDLTDLVTDENVIRSVWNKSRIRHASRFSKRKEPHVRILRHFGEGGAVILLFLGICSTINQCDWKIQLALYFSMIAVAIATDALKMSARFLARPSRAMIAGLIELWCIALFVKYKELWIVCSGLSLLAAFLIKICNFPWLDSENWLFTDAVNQVLVNDPDGNPVKIWEESAKREARVLAHELGVPVDNTILEGLLRPFVLLGISIVYKKLAKVLAMIQKYQDKAEEAERKLHDAEAQIKSSEDIYQQLQEERGNVYTLQLKNEALSKRIDELKQELQEKKKIEFSDEEQEDPVDQEKPNEQALDYKDYIKLSADEKKERDDLARELYKSDKSIGARTVQAKCGIPYKRTLVIRKEIYPDSASA